MQNRLQSLAAEVQNAAPADLFDADATKHHTPPLDVQQQQLQCITQVPDKPLVCTSCYSAVALNNSV